MSDVTLHLGDCLEYMRGVAAQFTLALAAYNVIRLPRLLAKAPA